MGYKPNKLQSDKVEHLYKTLYISKDKIEKINELAYKADSSFNGIVNGMIDYCLENLEDEE